MRKAFQIASVLALLILLHERVVTVSSQSVSGGASANVGGQGWQGAGQGGSSVPWPQWNLPSWSIPQQGPVWSGPSPPIYQNPWSQVPQPWAQNPQQWPQPPQPQWSPGYPGPQLPGSLPNPQQGIPGVGQTLPGQQGTIQVPIPGLPGIPGIPGLPGLPGLAGLLDPSQLAGLVTRFPQLALNIVWSILETILNIPITGIRLVKQFITDLVKVKLGLDASQCIPGWAAGLPGGSGGPIPIPNPGGNGGSSQLPGNPGSWSQLPGNNGGSQGPNTGSWSQLPGNPGGPQGSGNPVQIPNGPQRPGGAPGSGSGSVSGSAGGVSGSATVGANGRPLL